MMLQKGWIVVAKIEISLPDQLAEEAQRAGLLSSPRVEEWLREQIRKQRTGELFAAMDRMAAVPNPTPMSPEEVAREISLMRAERRAKAAR